MKNFDGTPEEAWAERKRLRKVHGINMIRAGCYLNNYFDDFLCKDCHAIVSCGEIHIAETEKTVEESGAVTGAKTGQDHIQDCVTEATDVGM